MIKRTNDPIVAYPLSLASTVLYCLYAVSFSCQNSVFTLWIESEYCSFNHTMLTQPAFIDTVKHGLVAQNSKKVIRMSLSNHIHLGCNFNVIIKRNYEICKKVHQYISIKLLSISSLSRRRLVHREMERYILKNSSWGRPKSFLSDQRGEKQRTLLPEIVGNIWLHCKGAIVMPLIQSCDRIPLGFFIIRSRKEKPILFYGRAATGVSVDRLQGRPPWQWDQVCPCLTLSLE